MDAGGVMFNVQLIAIINMMKQADIKVVFINLFIAVLIYLSTF